MTQTSTVIRIGDKFKVSDTIYEVIGTKPGGKVELFNRAESLFTDRWHRDVMHWERVTA